MGRGPSPLPSGRPAHGDGSLTSSYWTLRKSGHTPRIEDEVHDRQQAAPTSRRYPARSKEAPSGWSWRRSSDPANRPVSARCGRTPDVLVEWIEPDGGGSCTTTAGHPRACDLHRAESTTSPIKRRPNVSANWALVDAPTRRAMGLVARNAARLAESPRVPQADTPLEMRHRADERESAAPTVGGVTSRRCLAR
jgi:hypothetical protein